VIVLAIGGTNKPPRSVGPQHMATDEPRSGRCVRMNSWTPCSRRAAGDCVSVQRSPLSINNVAQNAPSFRVLYLGQECGRAVATSVGDVIRGKLPISIPRSVGHLPYFTTTTLAPRAISGRRFAAVSVRFGLSYTKFNLAELRLAQKKITRTPRRAAGGRANTGQRSGAEVVQMYIRDCVSSVSRPGRS